MISLSRLNRKFLFFLVGKISQERKKKQMPEKLAKRLCKLISWYNETKQESYYHYFMGYLLAMQNSGIQVQIIRNEFVICNGEMYKVEDYK